MIEFPEESVIIYINIWEVHRENLLFICYWESYAIIWSFCSCSLIWISRTYIHSLVDELVIVFNEIFFQFWESCFEFWIYDKI